MAPTNTKNKGRSQCSMKNNLNKKIDKIKSYKIFSDDEIQELLELKSTEILKIFKWKECAKCAGIDVKISDYMNNPDWNTITSMYDFNYYKLKYSSYDYHKIYNISKSKMIRKRGSMYDPENIAKKKNISIEEAILLSERRKDSTKITKENLIKKYGPEIGIIKYQDFVNKSMSTINNYKKRYGNGWKERWDYFLSTRDSSSLSACISKYGDDGERIFAERVIKFKKSSDINYYMEKYGDDEGPKIFEKINSMKAEGAIRSWSFEEFKKKNQNNSSEEELMEIFNLKLKKRSTKTIEYFLQKGFSLDDSKELRLNSIEKLYRSSEKNSPVSKESIRLFSALQSELNRVCKFGTKKKELSLRYDDRLYFFDFFDEKTNTIIEYNGSIFHAPEKLSISEREMWKSKYGLGWHDVNRKDNQKLDAARSAGYNIMVVWDYEVRSKTKLKEKIKELVNTLGRTNES